GAEIGPERSSPGHGQPPKRCCAARLTRVTNAASTGTFSTFAYALDAAGNRTATTANGLTRRYGYDALNQLVSQTIGTQVTTWSYDAVGNRLSQVTPSGTTNYSYDAADRLLSAGATTFTYDGNGNRISQTNGAGTTTYSYDAANRLATVIGSGVNSSFAYDGDGNRIGQNTAVGNYSCVNDTAVALPVVLNEQGPEGSIDFTYGLNLIESASSSFNYFYGYDGLGSVVALTDGVAGRAVTVYSYDAWGNAVGNGSVGLKNKFRFTGEALDPGTQLYYLRARYFDPGTGSFLTPDPLRHLTLPQRSRSYAYAGDNPLRFADPSGMTFIADLSNSLQSGFWSLGFGAVTIAKGWVNTAQFVTAGSIPVLNTTAGVLAAAQEDAAAALLGSTAAATHTAISQAELNADAKKLVTAGESVKAILDIVNGVEDISSLQRTIQVYSMLGRPVFWIGASVKQAWAATELSRTVIWLGKDIVNIFGGDQQPVGSK